MTSLSDCTSVRYRAAISLNNSAVTLLKREQYKDAVDTFRVSISIVQAIIEEMKNPNIVERNSISTLYNDINHQLQVASHRCATASLATEMNKDQSNGKLAMIKIFSQQDPSTIIDTFIDESGDNTTNGYTFIIIEPLNQDDVSLDLIGLDCHSILYNFGIAHCLLASQISSSLISDRILIDNLRQSAFRLFRLMEPYFVARLSLYPTNSKLDDRSVLQLFAFFAKAMSDVASQLQYTTVYETYKSTLLELLLSIGQHETLIPTRCCPAPAA
jgi:hypothetical protein